MSIDKQKIYESPLGKVARHADYHDATLLFPIARNTQRDALNIPNPIPFKGVDIWNAYELSWLNSRGKPCLAIAEFIFPCTSPYLIESKSFKLYINSFSQTIFNSLDSVKETLYKDLSAASHSPVFIKLSLLPEHHQTRIINLTGEYLDELDVAIDTYSITPEFLSTEKKLVTETLCSNLLKSNCLVTGQPDWASIQISYTGNKINHAGLLKYLISFRTHNDFHEHCVENIFMDILKICAPEKLTVYARYTRRGGLDINPYRSTEDTVPKNIRTARQ